MTGFLVCSWTVFFNCIVLAIDWHGMPQCGAFFSTCVMDSLNFVFTLIFMAEMIIKIVGLTFHGYLQVPP
eukprot:COSAG05_NODE_2950_length_2473_cov_60.232098_8_plen_69_part_01